MELSLYDAVYIITNAFRTYMIYKLMYIFCEDSKVDKRWEILSYFAYTAVITYFYLFIEIPMVMLAVNVIGLYLVTCIYEVGIKQRLLSATFIYMILLCVESFVVLISGYTDLPIFLQSTYSSVFGILLISILTYVIVLFLQNSKNVKKGRDVPVLYWISIVAIPVITLFIIVVLFNSGGLSNTLLIFSISFLFIINIITFTLFDSLIVSFEYQMEKKMLMQQNNYYESQFELMKRISETTRAFRHDFMNHLTVIQSLIQKDEKKTLEEYLSELQQVYRKQKEYVRTGNVVVDSILNCKLQEAEMHKIPVTYDINIPDEMNFSTFDITIILSNLLDNAMKASLEIDKDMRNINIVIRVDKGVLRITIKNKFNGMVLYRDGNIVTSKKDVENHGIGLENVKKVVKKYHGTLDIKHTEDEFSVIALLLNN
ncbi:MAG TPA: GHKL domain-containing protein [Clostridiales bacterium]|nr:GHKL domain-containing protein [Clostridiales bacterium]